MNKQTVTLNTGNFQVIVSGIPVESHLEKLVKSGIVNELQRTPATKAYLALVGIPGKKEGSLKFPEKFERDSVKFDVTKAEVMREEVEKYFSDKLGELKVVVIEHVKEESADGRDTARSLIAKWTAEGKLEKKLELLDFEGDSDNDEEVVDFVHGALVKRP